MTQLKSFLLMRSTLECVEIMTDAEAGQLFKAIIDTVDNKQPNIPQEIKFPFANIKKQLDENRGKYLQTVEKNRINGSKGGRPKKTQTKPNNPVGLNKTQKTQAKRSNLDVDLDFDLEVDIDSKKTLKDLGDKSPASTPQSKLYTDDFLRCWFKYPKRAGGNNKQLAAKAFSARLKAGNSVIDMEAGLDRYIKLIRATDRERTEYVLQGSTFFGPSNRWEDDFLIPVRRAADMSVTEHNQAAIAEAMRL